MIKKAITLAETLIVLSVIGILALLTLPFLNDNLTEYTEKVAILKANNVINEIIDNLLNNSSYYSSNHNFAYNATSPTGQLKFQNSFKSLLSNVRNETAQGTPCYKLNGKTIVNGYCITGIDNIAWGIPNTDFTEINTITVKKNGIDIPYVPIVVYVNYDLSAIYKKTSASIGSSYEVIDETEASEYFYNNAIIYGVRRDGDIIFIDGIIDKTEYPDALHFKAQNYVSGEEK